MHERERPVDRVRVADGDVEGEIGADVGHLGGVGHSAGVREDGLHPVDVVSEPAEGIGDVEVDLVLVAGEPLEAGATRLERRVERVEADAVVQIESRLEEIDRAGAGQGHGIDAVAVVEQVLLGRERAHAVGEQDERQAGVLRAAPIDHHVEVFERAGPPIGADDTGLGAGGDGRAVSAAVVAVHEEPGIGQRLG